MRTFENWSPPSNKHPEGWWSDYYSSGPGLIWSDAHQDKYRWRWIDYHGKVLEIEFQCLPGSTTLTDEYHRGRWGDWESCPEIKASRYRFYDEGRKKAMEKYRYDVGQEIQVPTPPPPCAPTPTPTTTINVNIGGNLIINAGKETSGAIPFFQNTHALDSYGSNEPARIEEAE